VIAIVGNGVISCDLIATADAPLGGQRRFCL
jgi:hypothetical protein